MKIAKASGKGCLRATDSLIFDEWRKALDWQSEAEELDIGLLRCSIGLVNNSEARRILTTKISPLPTWIDMSYHHCYLEGIRFISNLGFSSSTFSKRANSLLYHNGNWRYILLKKNQIIDELIHTLWPFFRSLTHRMARNLPVSHKWWRIWAN